MDAGGPIRARDLEPSLARRLRGLKLAVVGHVEWAEFVRVPHMPRAGEIVHVSSRWEAPAGGGAVTAVQLAAIAGTATFFTALGDDELGHRAAVELRALGVDVRAAFRVRQPQRRVFVHLDDRGERTITVIGDRMGPRRRDPLGWSDLGSFDAVYVTAGDVGALRATRQARTLTASARAMPLLRQGGVAIDVLVRSAGDAGERYRAGELDPPPALVVATEHDHGGRWSRRGDGRGRYAPVAPPGPVVDTYGCGDVFAGVLTAGIAADVGLDAALELGARCGAWCAAGEGPYGRRPR
jgi:ribokinase